MITPEERQRIALRHSQFHGGGTDECSTDPSSPCTAVALIRAEERADWRDDAQHRANRADSHLVFARRILRLLDSLEAAEAERDALAVKIARIEGLPDRMAEAWGGDSMWITTATHVANLVRDWLADDQDDDQ